MKQITLTKGQVAIVCDCHAHLVENHKWYALVTKDSRMVGAARNASVKERLTGLPHTILMHVIINNTPKGYDTDHVNRNPFDNRCENLRTATHFENMRNMTKRSDNTSGYKGVSWFKPIKKWRAHIQVNGKHKNLGYFKTAEDAALAYDKAAKELFGEFANPNSPDGG